MIVFFSCEIVEVAFTSEVQHDKHIVVEQKSPGLYTVIKEGVKLRSLLTYIAEIKQKKMEQHNLRGQLASPVFVSFSAKARKHLEKYYKIISPQFQKYLLYFDINPHLHKQIQFNRSQIHEREICYGQGFSQLRSKEELRVAATSLLGIDDSRKLIFIERNPNELKELKKEGFKYLLQNLQIENFMNAYLEIQKQPSQKDKKIQLSQEIISACQNYKFAQKYIAKIYKKNQKDFSLKQLYPFELKQTQGRYILRKNIFRPSHHINMIAKSLIRHEKSKEISSFVFTNLADHRIYIARGTKPKQILDDEQIQNRNFAVILSVIVNPNLPVIPHQKVASFIKFSKIKAYENKKAYLNVRPYVQNLQSLSQMILDHQQALMIMREGNFRGKKIKGMGSILFISLLLNQNFSAKKLFEQITIVSKNKMTNSLNLVRPEIFQENNQQEQFLFLRTDFYELMDSSTFKVLNAEISVFCKQEQVKVNLEQIYSEYIAEMIELCEHFQNKEKYIMGVFLFYAWEYNKISYYPQLKHRLFLIQQLIKVQYKKKQEECFLEKYPLTAGLLMSENYEIFMLGSKKQYFIQPKMQEDEEYENIVREERQENPYMTYTCKTCSFSIYNLNFPVHLYLQWVRSILKYQVIQYFSFLNKTADDYYVLDKRLKFTQANEKKTAILIVDHAELSPSTLNYQRSCKHVFIFRLKKIQVENLGIVIGQASNKPKFEDNEEQIIKILFKNAPKKNNSVEKYFKMYQWVFHKYIEYKCDLYDLNFIEALNFLAVFHRCISTNKHRLLELQQKYPKQSLYLYTFPIFKNNQKILLANNLFEYLHVWYLFRSILDNSWKRRLETHQNSSVLAIRSIIEEEVIEEVALRLIDMLKEVPKAQKSSDQLLRQQNEILQLLKSLTGGSQNTEYLYNTIFAQTVTHQNFNKIKQLWLFDSYLVVREERGFFIENYMHFCSKRQYFCNQILICANFKRQDLELDCIVIDPLTKQVVMINYKIGLIENCIQFQKKAQELVVCQFPKVIQENPEERITEMQRANGKAIVASALKNTLDLFNFQTNGQSNKLIIFDHPIIHLFFHKQYLICITCTGLNFFNIYQTISISHSAKFQKISPQFQPYSFTNSINQEIFSVGIWSLNSVYLARINLQNFQLICEVTLNFPKKIASLGISDSIIYIFYEGEDTLNVYEWTNQEATLEVKGRYYWVESNCKQIHCNHKEIFLRGRDSYIKRIKIKS